MGLGGRLVNAFQHVLIRSRFLEVCTSSSDAQPEGVAHAVQRRVLQVKSNGIFSIFTRCAELVYTI